MILTPSSSALAISSSEAGISCLCSRHTSVTVSAPSLVAVRATSIATLPPPHTITFLPIWRFINPFTSTRKFRPNFAIPSPSIPKIGCFHAPVSKNTALLSFSMSSIIISLPTVVSITKWTPISAIAFTTERT